MNNVNNFPQNCKSYLRKRGVKTAIIEQMEQKNLISYNDNKICFKMKNLDGDITGVQERYIKPIILHDKEIKTKTQFWWQVSYFYLSIDYKKPIIICEWEIDFLSLAYLENVIGLQWINGLKWLLEQLFHKWASYIYILTDSDPASDKAIWSLLSLEEETLINVYDARNMLWKYKDVNDYTIGEWDILLEAIYDNAKSLGGFLNLYKSFIEYGTGGKISISYNNFVKYLIGKFSYESAKGNIFSYKHEGIWEIVDPDELKNTIKKELECFNFSKITRRDIEEIFELIRIDSFSPKLRENLLKVDDKDINFVDCIYNVHTKEKRPYSKLEYKRHKLQYHSSLLQNNEKPELFLSFLHQIFEGYSQVDGIIEFLREYIAHLFLPLTKFELALFFRWNAANWKWTIMRVIEHLLSENNVSYLWINNMYKAEKVSALFSKLANLDTEMSYWSNLNSAEVKKIISGEKTEGRFLYKDGFFFRPYARIIIASNSIWKVRDFADNGAFRRFIFIYLKQTFLWREDVDLKEKLIQELDKIFAWSIQSLENLLNRNKFVIPSELMDQTKEAFKEQDSILLFLEDCMQKWPEFKIYNKDLYSMYKRFCKDTWEIAVSQIVLSKRLLSLWFKRFWGNDRGFSGLWIKNNSNMTNMTDIL